jgi:hypothetical protein
MYPFTYLALMNQDYSLDTRIFTWKFSYITRFSSFILLCFHRYFLHTMSDIAAVRQIYGTDSCSKFFSASRTADFIDCTYSPVEQRHKASKNPQKLSSQPFKIYRMSIFSHTIRPLRIYSVNTDMSFCVKQT